jgi:hypothetical protein
MDQYSPIHDALGAKETPQGRGFIKLNNLNVIDSRILSFRC